MSEWGPVPVNEQEVEEGVRFAEFTADSVRTLSIRQGPDLGAATQADGKPPS